MHAVPPLVTGLTQPIYLANVKPIYLPTVFYMRLLPKAGQLFFCPSAWPHAISFPLSPKRLSSCFVGNYRRNTFVNYQSFEILREMARTSAPCTSLLEQHFCELSVFGQLRNITCWETAGGVESTCPFYRAPKFDLHICGSSPILPNKNNVKK